MSDTNVMRSTYRVSWAQSPDGTSLIEVRWSPRGLRAGYTINRLNLAGEYIVTIARRTTEKQARKRANFAWFVDKYGDAEGNRRYLAKYRAA